MPDNELVHLMNAAIDICEDKAKINGRICPHTLNNLKIGDYQREELKNPHKNRQLMVGYRSGDGVPDIELSMRGKGYSVIKEIADDLSGKVVVLLQPTYIVDGYQRVAAAKDFMEEGGYPWIRATVNIDKTREWEFERFRIMNAFRTSLSPNILLRNQADFVEGMTTLYNLSMSDDFPMGGRICWDQTKKKSDLMNASPFVKNICILHEHATQIRTSNTDQMGSSIDQIQSKIGKEIFRANAKSFYALIDESWGLSSIEPNDKPTQLRTAFQITLAQILSRHEDFWSGDRLKVNAATKKKLKSFPIQQDHIQKASSTGTKPDQELSYYLIKHLNKGKRKAGHLKEREED